MGATHNSMSGSAGIVVQAGEIGSVTFKLPPEMPRVAPAQAPPPPGGFTDRAEEMAFLTRLVDRPGHGSKRPVLCVIGGVVGVGKTAFLRHAADVIGRRFPDGVLHADCGPDGESPSEALGRFLFGLGVPEERVPAGFGNRLDLYRSMTNGLRLLVVLDEVSEATQVTELLPNSPDSLVLVGKAHHSLDDLLADGDVHYLRLKQLSPVHGVELMTRICQDGRIEAEPEPSTVLAQHCDRLPVTLRIAAGRLVSRRRWTVSRLVERLREEELSGPGIDAVRKVLTVVYEGLPEPQRQLYRHLGVLVGARFNAEVIVAMAGRPGEDVLDDLDALRQADLVEQQPDGTFGMHRLFRLHALGRAGAEDTHESRKAALHRALRWWLVGAVAADVAVTGVQRLRTVDHRVLLGDEPVSIPDRAAMHWLAKESANIVALMAIAYDHKWYDEVWQLFEALFPYLDARKPLATWINAGEIAVRAAARSGNAPAEARSRSLLAKAFQELERYDRAHEQLDVARELASGHDRIYASCVEFTGNVHMRQREYGTALACFEQSLAINERLGLQRGTAMQLMLVGRALGKLDRVSEALTALARSRALAERADAKSLLAKVLLSTGQVLIDAGRDDEAETVLREALGHATRLEWTAVEADVLHRLGILTGKRGDTVAARELLDRARTAFEKVGSPLAARLLLEL